MSFTMTVDVREWIAYSPLNEPAKNLQKIFKEHPQLYKGILLVNHVFRAAAMVGFMQMLSYSMMTNIAVCVGFSALYRLTVEKNCAFKFALPALGGSVAFLVSKQALLKVIQGTAFHSINAFVSSSLALLPLCTYIGYVTLVVDHEVNAFSKK